MFLLVTSGAGASVFPTTVRPASRGRRLLLSALLLGLALPGRAQQRLSLSQAQAAALEHNYVVKNRGLSLTSAQEGQRAARWKYYPSVSAFGLGVYGFKNLVPLIPDVLPRGLNNLYVTGLMVSQTIYAGGQVGIGNHLADLQTAVQDVSYAAVQDSVGMETEQKYWQVVQVQEQVKTLRASEGYLDQLLKELADNLKAGLIARNDLLKVRVQRSQVRLNRSRAANARQLALLDLGLFTGLPTDSLTVLTDSLETVFNPARLYVSPRQAAENSRTHELLTKGVENQRLQTYLKQGSYRPTVSAGASGVAAGAINRGLGTTFTPTATLTVNVPISDRWGESRHTLKQRRLAETQAENNLANGTQQLQVDVTSAWNGLTEAYERVGLATESLAQAAENLKVNRANYRAGLNPLSDLLDAQRLSQQASSELIEAQADFQAKLSSYKYLTTQHK
jgi:outer membrane protein